MKEKNVFGLPQLSYKVPTLIKKKVKNRYNPDKWTWTPHDPEGVKKIVSIRKKEHKSVFYSVITNYRPSKTKKQKIVLVMAMGSLSYGIVKHLEKAKVKYFFFDYVHFLISGKVIINNNERILQMGEATLSLDDVKFVIWTPPRFPKPTFSFLPMPKKDRHKFLFKARWAQLLRDIALLIPEDAIWIPGVPQNGSQEWQNKLGEYHLAEKIGLNVPPYTFTNDKDEVLKFAKEHGKKILLREFSIPPYSFPPIKIDVNRISFKYLGKSPTCFQKYIEKEHEYRVVVLFDKIFPCKIHSQDSELTKNDWRVHDDANVKWELTTLPNDLIEKLLEMKNKLNLNWCSIDLIYGKDKKYYYLEANRPGAHYWLQAFVGLDITKEIVNEIKNKL